MAAIDRDLILRLADLAHLTVADDETARVTEQLGAIMAYVDKLQEVDVEGVEPMTHAHLARMPLREDAVRASLSRDDVLSQAPLTRDGSFAVAAFVDEG